MRFEIHSAGHRSAATLLGEYPTFSAAADAFAAGPVGEREPWAIVPSGTADDLAAIMDLDSIAPRYGDGGVYVLREAGGYSCLGFDYAERQREAVAEWLAAEGRPLCESLADVAEAIPGSLAAYRRYMAAMAAGRAHNASTGRRCPAGLTPQLNGLEGKRVEVIDRHGEQRRFYVGKSTGWMPCHLEIAHRTSIGGGSATGAPFQSVQIVGQR